MYKLLTYAHGIKDIRFFFATSNILYRRAAMAKDLQQHWPRTYRRVALAKDLHIPIRKQSFQLKIGGGNHTQHLIVILFFFKVFFPSLASKKKKIVLIRLQQHILYLVTVCLRYDYNDNSGNIYIQQTARVDTLKPDIRRWPLLVLLVSFDHQTQMHILPPPPPPP